MLGAIFFAYLFVILSDYWLKYLNLSRLKKQGTFIPPEFEGSIDQALLRKTRDYVIENTKYEVLLSLFQSSILLIFLFGNLFAWYNSWVVSLQMPFVLSGLLFFLFLLYADTFLTIPFKLYHTFKIENTYGFTTTTLKLWITDFIKSLMVSTILTAIVISAGLFIVQKSPHLWWFWVWCFFFAFSIIIMYLFPYVIAPIFNKFTPIEDETLKAGIQNIMKKVGIKVKQVFQMDASRRTKHTNAYFTGIGKVKRIVLYDTLVDTMNSGEILSVLAHEAGHWKKRHLLKHLIASEIIALFVMFVVHKLLQNDFLIDLFHVKESTFLAKVVIISFLGSIVSYPFSPLKNYFSRRNEFAADLFSNEITGDSRSMISTLVKLSRDNLSNLHPHPLYAAFHYSHPPVLERIRAIQKWEKNKRTG